MEFNNLLNRNNLTVGMEIIIPNYQPPAEAGEAGAEPGDAVSPAVPGANVVHVVQAGQGLFEIAGIYGVSADAIIQANNLVDSNLLRAGQELIIPGVTQRDVLVRQGATCMSYRAAKACSASPSATASPSRRFSSSTD